MAPALTYRRPTLIFRVQTLPHYSHFPDAFVELNNLHEGRLI